ncbi:MAG TPA: hypothetical protein VF035_08770, partial [Longimicrobiales bacterium]
ADVRHVDIPLRETWTQIRARPAGTWFLLVNAFWNAAIDGVRPYLFIFATVVIGVTVAEGSLLMIPTALALIGGSVFFGRADRRAYATIDQRAARGRLLQAGAILTIVSMVIGIFMRNVPVALISLVIGGFGMAALVTLGYPLFANLMGEESAGQYTGLFVVSVGLGRVVAPVVIGAAVHLAQPLFPTTQGYPMMWVVATAFMLLTLFTLRHTLALSAQQRSS